MQITINKHPAQTIIRLKGRFEFDARRDFDAASTTALATPAAEIQVNLSEVDYMDSSALGMLLVLRDKALVQGKKVTLVDARGLVKQILEVANFHKLF
jgi:HptB-dependent secretion and biofilm anti anti-sigma factor